MATIKLLFFRGLSAAALILATIFSVFHPLSAWIACVLLVLYLLLLIRYRNVWPIALLALLPVLDFSLWTGNLLYNEYDILLLATLAVLFWNKNNRYKEVAAPACAILYRLMLAAYTLSLLRGLWPVFQGYPQSDDIYQNYWNSVRVGKGFFYAWMLWPFLRDELITAPQNTKRMLAIGIVSSLSIFGVLVFWERHVFSALMSGGDRYAVLSTLLDFSSTYRITGWFTEMHVGGEAVDGYLIAQTPLAVYLLTRPLRKWEFLLAALAAALGFYAIIVTFTRTTIASFGISLIMTLVTLALHKRHLLKENGHAAFILLTLALIGFFGLFYGYKLAGYQALLAGFICFAVAVLLGYYAIKQYLLPTIAGIILLFAFSVIVIADSAIESKWHHESLYTSVTNAFMLSAWILSAAIMLGRVLKINSIALQRLQMPAIFMALFLFLVIGLGSTRFSDRFSQVSADFAMRKNHWIQVVSFRDRDDFFSQVIGEGIGTMPKLYYRNNILKRALPTFRVSDNNGKPFFILGSGDFNIMQKVILPSGASYEIKSDIRFKSLNDNLNILVCEKHILYSEHYQPECIINNFRATKIREWQTFRWTVNSNKLGQFGFMDWPTTLLIHNEGANSVDIGSITVTDRNNHQYVRNSNFKKGMQDWFWVADFDHLPWHSKGLFIHIWLEQGWLGLLLFLGLIFFAILRQGLLLAKGNPTAVAFLPVVVALVLEGLTGTMIDAPRICMLVSVVLLSAVQWPETQRKKFI
jgi:hypothetical protein